MLNRNNCTVMVTNIQHEIYSRVTMLHIVEYMHEKIFNADKSKVTTKCVWNQKINLICIYDGITWKMQSTNYISRVFGEKKKIENKRERESDAERKGERDMKWC